MGLFCLLTCVCHMFLFTSSNSGVYSDVVHDTYGFVVFLCIGMFAIFVVISFILADI